MEQTKCKYCDKIIEGYSKKHVEYLLSQHHHKHKKEIMLMEKHDKELNGEPNK